MGRPKRLRLHPARYNRVAALAPSKNILRALQEDPSCFRTAQQGQEIYHPIQQHHHRRRKHGPWKVERCNWKQE